MECSRATIERTIEDMRDFLGAPLKYDRSANGYLYDGSDEAQYQLPGLWLNASELTALLTIQSLLSGIQPGLLDEQLAPLKQRIQKILALRPVGGGEIGRRMRILSTAVRSVDNRIFQSVASAAVKRERLALRYHGRGRDELTARVVSPQHLVHYRDNWYLDAWCHQREALRSFALDRIISAQLKREPALDVATGELEAHYTRAYGIFSGEACEMAELRFTSHRARWVADERWHPEQQGRFLEDGSYELRIPYSDPRELMMDVMKYGADVVVVAPEGLRLAVASALEAAAARYR